MSKLKIPKFANESEEADWWYDNREQVADEFVAASREGRLHGRIDGVRTRLPARILFGQEDLTRITRLAETRGISVDELVRSFTAL